MNYGPIYKIVSYLFVGMLWGCTNPFLKAGSSKAANEDKKSNNEASWYIRTKSTLKKFLRPSVFVPIAINQCGSVAFYYLLATDDISTAVPICNSLTFAFTGITGWALGEKIYRPSLFILGVVLVILGISLCAISTPQ